MNAPPAARRRALVTGASSGIGLAFAERLARDGYDLIAVARRRDRLDALAERLGTDHGSTVEPLVADLTDRDELRTVEQRIAEDRALDLLVNNAGFSGYMPFIELDPDRAEELIRLHGIATTRLTHAALPAMIDRGQGAIINVSSLLAFSASVPASSPLPKRAVYAACKAYIATFTELLHHELEGTGVRVQALCPGATRGTEFHSDLPGYDESRFQISADEIVQASLAGLQMGEVLCIPSLDDPEAAARVRESERQLLARAARAPLAKRYTE
jgi:short-subunit dehydrogenase